MNCKPGTGMVICEALGAVAVFESERAKIVLLPLPGRGPETPSCLELERLSRAPCMTFPEFTFECSTGWMACVKRIDNKSPLLLVTDLQNETVRVVDVRASERLGDLLPPGAIPGCHRVAGQGHIAAVVSWGGTPGLEGVVRLFRNHGAEWDLIAMTPGQGPKLASLVQPLDVCLSYDEKHDPVFAVSDLETQRVTLFRVRDGSLIKPLGYGNWPTCVVYLGKTWYAVDHASGMLVALEGSAKTAYLLECSVSGRIHQVRPTAISSVPGVGLVVRCGTCHFIHAILGPVDTEAL